MESKSVREIHDQVGMLVKTTASVPYRLMSGPIIEEIDA